MNTETSNISIDDATKESPFHLPCVTIILPIEQRPTKDHITSLTDEIAKELTAQHGGTAQPIIEKLYRSLSGIRYGSSKKSVFIFISPLYEKAIYLDVHLDEKVIIDEQFEIRDLVNSMRPADKFLVLVQSAEHFSIFLGGSSHLLRVKVDIADHIAAYKNDVAEQVENFSDAADRKEIMLDKFIHHIDKELDAILKKYKLPVFVVGPERMNGHLKKYTHHEKAIVDYIHGNYDRAKPHQLLQLIQPYLKILNDIENTEIMQQVERALNANKLCCGINDVWRNVMHNKGNRLLVERDFTFPHKGGPIKNEIAMSDHEDGPALVKDAVDIIIEKVLESGGEVRFTDRNLLRDHGHIVLFQYY